MAPTASAHPLGNVSVNYYEGLRLTARQVQVATLMIAGLLLVRVQARLDRLTRGSPLRWTER